MLSNHNDYNVKRNALCRVCERITHALEKKFSEHSDLNEKQQRLWLRRAEHVSNFARHHRNLLRAQEEFVNFRNLAIGDSLFTEEDFAKFGNGHPRGCICIDCVNLASKLSKRAKKRAWRVETSRAVQIQQHLLRHAQA